jgi:hypothetical protein
VFLRLLRGFRVLPQHELVGYRIDLLVEGPAAGVAVECDSDRWQGPWTFENDLLRQRMLQRCGLSSSRVRGTAFCRDPGATLEPLWADLRRHDIPPQLALPPGEAVEASMRSYPSPTSPTSSTNPNPNTSPATKPYTSPFTGAPATRPTRWFGDISHQARSRILR